MTLQLTGIHHLTAITAEAPANVAFYTKTLGLRLVKKTVNQDDTSAYHLFYADGEATPGSDLTFFDWPTPREKRGTHSIARTGLRVSGEKTLGKLSGKISSCKNGSGGNFEATMYVSTDGSVLAVGVTPPDEPGVEDVDCLVSALKQATFPSPGSWPAKVTFAL